MTFANKIYFSLQKNSFDFFNTSSLFSCSPSANLTFLLSMISYKLLEMIQSSTYFSSIKKKHKVSSPLSILLVEELFRHFPSMKTTFHISNLHNYFFFFDKDRLSNTDTQHTTSRREWKSEIKEQNSCLMHYESTE